MVSSFSNDRAFFCAFAGNRRSKLGEPVNCLVLEREEGAPTSTIAEHQLQLDLEHQSEAAKFLAGKSESAFRVCPPYCLATMHNVVLKTGVCNWPLARGSLMSSEYACAQSHSSMRV
jgi:hypothetical protein